MTGVPCVHVPAWQVSAPLQALASAHEVPFGLAGSEQRPVLGSQTPALWHWLLATQVTGVPGVHVPAWHVSAPLQALASAHEVPLGLGGSEHRPVVGSQMPALWHWLLATQVTGIP